jgi:hypothetical protein
MDAKENARARNAQGLCLVCDSSASGSRGLCTAHYLEIYRFLKALPDDERARKEADAIESGRLLPAGVARKPGRKPSAFADLKADQQKPPAASAIAVTKKAEKPISLDDLETAVAVAEQAREYAMQADDDEALIRETIARLQRRLIEIEARKKPAYHRKSR